MTIRNKFKKKFFQIYKQKEIKEHNLQYLFLEITQNCNLSCLHCGSDCSKDLHSPELTTDSWFKIIDYFKKHYSDTVSFILTGGEPLIHKDIFSIASYINKLNIKWGMVTNGILLTPNNLKKLIEAGISSITLSLDGKASSHNWLRNHKDAYRLTINALKLIFCSNIKYKDIVTCVSPRNLYELDDIAELLIENKVTDWRLFRIFPSGRAQSNNQLELTFEQTQEMLTWIEENKAGLKKRGLNLNMSCEGWIPFEKDIRIRETPFFCRSGINIASILADGKITGCNNNHSSFYLGNIITDNFSKLWNSDFHIFRKKEWLKNTMCYTCNYFKSCNGGSIHLWDKKNQQPNFCYAKKL